jgi:hypothetical protein
MKGEKRRDQHHDGAASDRIRRQAFDQLLQEGCPSPTRTSDANM